MTSALPSLGGIASPPSPCVSRNTPSSPFPVQRRGGNWQTSRRLDCNGPRGDARETELPFFSPVQGHDPVLDYKAARASTSAGPVTSVCGRRLGPRLLFCLKKASQGLSLVCDCRKSGQNTRGRVRYSSQHRTISSPTNRQEMRHIRPLDPIVASRYCTNYTISSRYTIYNFLFKNLYEQFRRPLNFYFLLVTLLQFISVIAPVNPLSTLLPLLFAFTLTALKEGYDDVKRHQLDYTYNYTPRMVLDAETNSWKACINADICVGDVLLLRDGEEIPCDVVVLGATSSVYIRTDNLDGEIDLKPREIVQWSTVNPEDQSIRTDMVCHVTSETDPPSALSVMAGTAKLCIECSPPSAMIDSFEGRADIQLTMSEAIPNSSSTLVRVPLTHHHLLPQSCILKNVAQVLCVAVYTGDDTKLGMNKRETSVKWAQIDKDVSRFSVCIFICQVVCALVLGFMGFQANRGIHDTVWYLQLPANESSGSAIIYPLRFFLLTTVMIPVSFKFVVDVCKYYMAIAVEWDSAMMHTEDPVEESVRSNMSKGMGCKVKNSSILEDLGQIDYVLSDKTGTLTQNVMELHAVSVCPGHHIYLPEIASTSMTLGEVHETTDSSAFTLIQQFAQMVALCNTVEVVPAPSSSTAGEDAAVFSYHAASPDEVALCVGVRKLGVSLVHRDKHSAVLRMHRVPASSSITEAVPQEPYHRGSSSLVSREVEEGGYTEEERWTVHYTFQFSSEKKTMGVVVESCDSGRVWFVVKGADDRVMEMAASGPSTSVASGCGSSPALNSECEATLSMYSRRGLRTLLVALKELSRDDLAMFLQNIAEASRLTESRQTYLDSLQAQMESGVTIIGITAIEDKLQDGVQETINDMLLAGIKVWMLTGDKMETAEQIGLSCSLYRPGDMIIRIGKTPPPVDFGEGSRERYGATANVQNWRQRLLTFPMEILPPSSYPRGSQPINATPKFTSDSLAQAYGKLLERRVFCFDANDSLPLSNNSLFAIAQEVDCVQQSAEGHGAGGLPERGDVRRGAVLVVEGGAVLETIFDDPTLLARFTDISSRCRSVICARTTPHQKAAITKFVRQMGFMTLSVGDGGNDVAMLQEAHIGVGIMGKEGQQAARAADFSIRQFSDLRALLFFHGQQAYARTAYIIKYSFYKSMLISFIQLAYNVVGTHLSGSTFWSGFSLTMWNGFYTLPQTVFYSLDRCAPRVVLERNPYLYKMTRRAIDISPCDFVSFLLRGILQSVGLLWLCTRLHGPGFAYADTGGTASKDVTFTMAYTAIMLSQVFSVWWESHSVTPLNLLMLLGMPLLYFYSTTTYSDRPALEYYGVFRRSLDIAGLYSAFGVSLALVVPSLIFSTFLVSRDPNPRDVLRRAEIRRQRILLARSDYKRSQSFWVRWLGATPEAASVMCCTGDDSSNDRVLDEDLRIF